MVLIPASSFQRKVLHHHIHTSHEVEHVDYHKTLKRAKLNFCWPKMRKDIKKAMREYLICQVLKGANSLPTGQLQPLPVPHLPWQDIVMDFVKWIPLSKGKSIILIVVDWFTKFSHFFVLSHPYTACKVAQIFFDGVFKLHGLPSSIIFDQDMMFTNSF